MISLSLSLSVQVVQKIAQVFFEWNSGEPPLYICHKMDTINGNIYLNEIFTLSALDQKILKCQPSSLREGCKIENGQTWDIVLTGGRRSEGLPKCPNHYFKTEIQHNSFQIEILYPPYHPTPTSNRHVFAGPRA